MAMKHALPVLALILLAAAPAPVPLAVQPGTELDRMAREVVAEDLAEARRRGDIPLVLVGSVQLGRPADRPALFVQLQSARECGSAGCNTSVWLPSADGWRKVLDGVSGPVAVADTRRRGMRDLIVGGDRYRWDGTRYVDQRPAPPVNLRPQ